MINPGEVIFLEGSYIRGYNSDNYFFRISNIKLLDTIGAAYTKSITIQLPLDQINNELSNTISAFSSEKKGKHSLKLMIVDESEEVNVTFLAEGGKINIDSGLIHKIQQLGLKYKLN